MHSEDSLEVIVSGRRALPTLIYSDARLNGAHRLLVPRTRVLRTQWSTQWAQKVVRKHIARSQEAKTQTWMTKGTKVNHSRETLGVLLYYLWSLGPPWAWAWILAPGNVCAQWVHYCLAPGKMISSLDEVDNDLHPPLTFQKVGEVNQLQVAFCTQCSQFAQDLWKYALWLRRCCCKVWHYQAWGSSSIHDMAGPRVML